jgi:hypothetical protein
MAIGHAFQDVLEVGAARWAVVAALLATAKAVTILTLHCNNCRDAPRRIVSPDEI